MGSSSGKDFIREANKPEKNEVPIWERYTLTIEEAAEYFRIGRARLRQLVHENPDADFLLMVGNRMQIKRKQFEKYIDKASVI
ncbi:MAG: excisionase [Lachnospiraceae bacterium]|nr:excisionase [Lachnospiraceae bacterium]